MSTIKEGYIIDSIIPISLEGINTIYNQMKFSVCRILKVGDYGTGFFCKLPYKSKLLPFLITNNHVIDNKYIENQKKIKISLKNGKELINIKIDETRIIISNSDLDFTLIEIKPNKDNINNINFLELDENINISEQFLNETYFKKSTYIIHYPKDDNVVISYGLLSGINEKEISHLCTTYNGSSGGPIMTLKDFKVIGIHYGHKRQMNYNKGTFMKSILSELNKHSMNSNIQNNEINYNMPQMNLNNIFQPNLKNINQLNLDIMHSSYNINNSKKNNDIEFPIQIINKSQYTLSVMAFPAEKKFINIIFLNDNGHKTNLMILHYKMINELLRIYAQVIGIDINKIIFTYNATRMYIGDQREISQVLKNIERILVNY